MTEPFRWKNCFADVASSGYGEMALSYLSDVIEPSLATLERRVGELREVSEHMTWPRLRSIQRRYSFGRL